MDTKAVTVLLVDDNDVDVEAVRRAFTSQRLLNPIVTAPDGQAALQMLQRGEVPRPNIVLLDLNLPRMNGIELLQALREDEHLTNSVVFVLTTSDAEEDRVASYELHVAGYILKSSVGRDFLRLIDMLDSYWRVVELPVT